MFLIGKANWWFPGWLDRILPRLSVDPELPPGTTGSGQSRGSGRTGGLRTRSRSEVVSTARRALRASGESHVRLRHDHRRRRRPGRRNVRGGQPGHRRGLRPGPRLQPASSSTRPWTPPPRPSGTGSPTRAPGGPALLNMADVLLASAGELAPVLTAEQGKPLDDANIEVFAAAMWCQYFADLETPPQVIQDDDEALVEVVRRPLGVVAAITPWNFPLILAFWKIAPALLAGNTMVLKPSPFTPLATLKVGELLRDVLPARRAQRGQRRRRARRLDDRPPGAPQDQLHRLHRDRQEGGPGGRPRPQAGHPGARRQRPGHRPGRRRPGRGGQGHLRRRLRQQRPGLLGHQAGLRPRALYDEVVEALADQARPIKVGDGTEPDTKLGPDQQRAPVRAGEGAGGRRPRPRGQRRHRRARPWTGPATSSSPPSWPACPTAPGSWTRSSSGRPCRSSPTGTSTTSVERANATHFGLSGSVWGTDTDRAAEVAGRLECGTAWVNTHLALAPQQPFGGFKWSGVGRGERALGTGRVHRDPGGAPLQERRRAQPQHRRPGLQVGRRASPRRRSSPPHLGAPEAHRPPPGSARWVRTRRVRTVATSRGSRYALLTLAAVTALAGCGAAPTGAGSGSPPASAAVRSTATSSGCGRRPSPTSRDTGATGTGDVVQTLRVGVLDRSYRLAVPTHYRSSVASPMILLFHGSGSNAMQTSAYTAMPKRAAGDGYLVATPDARGRPVAALRPRSPDRRPGLRVRPGVRSVVPVLRGPVPGLCRRHLPRVRIRLHRGLHPGRPDRRRSGW